MLRLVKQPALVLISGMLLVAFSFGQDTNDQAPNGQENTGAAPAATGLDTTTQLSENPPLSGLDQPSFEPGYSTRSYLAPHLMASEGVDTNAYGNTSGSSNLNAETRVMGSMELQKLWKTHPLDLDYVGGGVWYNGNPGSFAANNSNFFQFHSLAATQRLLWRTGQLAIRDSFSYLPEGTFGFGSYGGYGGINFGGTGYGGPGAGIGGGIAGGGGTGIFSSGQFGAIGAESRITNMSIADVTQYLSPRSSVVLAGGFEWTDFLNNHLGYVNSQATIAQAGYNYRISERDQVAVTYGFEELHFPSFGGGSANVNVWQLMYGRSISGRLYLRLSAGPQWVHLHQEVPFLVFLIPINSSFISASGHASLMYRVSSRTNAHLDYLHYINAGSGFFAGAKTDAFTLGAAHAFARRWSLSSQVGYSRNSRLLPSPTTVANNANSYSYWFLGVALRRQLNPHFEAFASYQYNNFGADSGFCGTTASACSHSYGQQIGLVGLSWTPRPIRLD